LKQGEDMQNVKIDKEFQSLIPPLSHDEYAQLEANILADGCREPLTLWGDILLDGHNRYKICTEHSIIYQTVEKDLPDREAAVEWIILNQFGRRNLLPFQRSELALRLKPIIEARAKANQKEHGGTAPGKSLMQKSAEVIDTREELAKLAGVSHDTIGKVSVIQKTASPEQLERARIGGKGNTVRAIYREVKGISPIKQPPQKADSSFKAIVADLKNMDKDTSYTPLMLLVEYQAFANSFVKSLEWYKQNMYVNLYPSLTEEDHKKIAALNTNMLNAVEKINQLQKGF
jgi:hypothetical protein